MGTPARFDPDVAVATWRRFMSTAHGLSTDDLDELETHLRDEVDELVTAGASPEDAFREARRRIGDYRTVEAAYDSIHWQKIRAEFRLMSELTNRLSMLKNYLHVAIRTLKRHPGYTFINVAGLAVGIAGCLLIGLYVLDELSFDRFHEHADSIYRVVAERGEGMDTHMTANTSYPVVPAMTAEFPEIEAATRLRRTFQPIVSVGDRRFREERFFLTDSTFFDVFSFTLVQGDPETVLDAPDAVVITDETARRYFGQGDPIGRTITYQTGDTPVEFTVTGILEDIPANSHIHVDFLGRIDHLGGPFGRWQVFVQNYSYVRLAPDAHAAGLEAKLPGLVDRHVRADLDPGDVFNLELQPLTDIHLHSDYRSEAEPNGRMAYVLLLSAIGLFILLLAGVNFINLTTARADRRAREIGMRKVIGAKRAELIMQFMGESVLLAAISMAFAVLLVAALLPSFNEFSGRALSLNLLQPETLAALVGSVLILGLAAGVWPAFYLSSLRPLSVLKGSRRIDGGGRARSGLVVFQFVISIALLVCTATVYDQMSFVRSADLGFDRDQVVIVPIDSRTAERAGALTSSLEEHSGIVRASASLLVPSTDPWTYSIRRLDRQDAMTTGFYKVDHAFVETWGLDVVAGRAFDEQLATDSTDAFMVNEEAARRLGFDSPEAIVGEQLEFGGGSRTGRVIGVIEDFNVQSLHAPIEPIVFFIEEDYYYLSARIADGSVEPALETIENRLAEFAPHLPFEYSFVDDRFAALHARDRQLGRVFSVFALIAVSIACLGLFGLASYTAQRRTREIGVRKVLGATSGSVVAMLTREFLVLVSIAFIIACPLAWYAMSRWLDGFAYRVDLGIGVFLAAGAAAMAVALITVSYQAARAAMADPIDSLRFE